MLAGLTSRCSSPPEWAESKAAAIGATMEATRLGAIARSRESRDRTSPPCTYRIAMNRKPSASPASNTGMICGSSIAAAALDSLMNRCRNESSAACAGAKIFSATRRPSRSSRALYTTAIPPWPIRSSIMYPPTRDPGLRPTPVLSKISLTTPPVQIFSNYEIWKRSGQVRQQHTGSVNPLRPSRRCRFPRERARGQGSA
jgi:hypothetical protein